MMESMYDLAFEFNGDNIRIEQLAGSLEGADVIDLHISQLRLLAERAGLLPPAPPMPDCQTASNDDAEMHHLHVVRDDNGTVNLYQTQLRGMGGSDEHVILHPTQAAWLGARLLALASPAKPVSSPLDAISKPLGDGCLPSATGCASGPYERDLFEEGATK